MKNLLIVGGGPGICDRARLLGAELSIVDRPQSFDPSLLAVAKRTILADYEQDEAITPMLRTLHHQAPFDGVLAMTELALLPAARIARALGLPTMAPEAVERTRDKVLMRRWLDSRGFATIASRAVRSSDEMARFAEEHGLPVIAKPRRGHSSQRISRFDSLADILRASISDEELIVEQFVEGPEYSVESFSFGNRHVIFAVTGKITNDQAPDHPYVEVGHVVPAQISETRHDAIEAYVYDLLEALEVRDVCAHTEIRWGRSGPVLIETHTRVGGDFIPTLVRNATGVDLLELAVRQVLGLATEQVSVATRKAGAAIRYFTPRAGVVRSVKGLERWRGEPGVVALHLPLRVGDRVKQPVDSFSRVGHVICVGSNGGEARQLCDAVLAGVIVDVATEEQP